MLRIGAIPVSPARKTTGFATSSGNRKSPNGPSIDTSAPAARFFRAAPPFPSPTRTQSCNASGRCGAEAIVYARDTPSGKRKFTHCPGSKEKSPSLSAIVSCSTLGARRSISVTKAECMRMGSGLQFTVRAGSTAAVRNGRAL